ncbi:putative Mce family protein [Nocardia neocaledoniensis NBRC 108232]|uniref:Phospholipid/cholesterol/gamma-HCH transport system substrate-binding protein n=1 Tax=Nocardia neocaledoniensis TaxID=236511 RepID=A0A317N188_9NOCA|nr:MlaD family protein [Nocardia neocaledoniensis]PWV67654.1 phospholipid/cholesterol/gamma-HCH transport system substrate-binding protein [Nocardia neocaledoniensis]GEM34097.1 putative Mce family protein [Nocardia neocaledoniensis NBRC 108232]
MQRLKFFSGDRPIMDEASKRARELRMGIIGLSLVVLFIIGAGIVYVVPLGKHTYTAELSEAQSVREGDDVRLAGISVGSVTSLELKPDKVLMEFTVDREVFVGDQTSLDIRMLTVVGGHYVALYPAGSRPLGDEPIHADRIRLPYSLIETFQDATAPLAAVDGDTVRQNLAAANSAIAASPEALRSTLDTVGKYVDMLDRQRSQVSTSIAILDEYISMYDGAKSDLGRLMDNVNLLEDVLLSKKAELAEAVRLLVSVVNRLAGLAPSWDSTLKPKAQELADALPRLRELEGRFEPLLGTVSSLQTKLSELATPEAGIVVDQSAVCVPLPGKAC